MTVLFDDHPPFQINGNFGAAAGVAEMLLQCHAGEISLLHALLKAWPNGSVKGLRARGGYEVDITWKASQLREARIKSKRGGEANIRVPAGTQLASHTPTGPEQYTIQVSPGSETALTAKGE